MTYRNPFVFFFLASLAVASCASKPAPEVPKILLADEPVVSVSEKAVPEYQKNRETVNAKGAVKAILCTSYQQFVPTSWLTHYVTKENYTFDRNGNISEEMIYQEGQRFSTRYRYFFDRKGNWLKRISLAENTDSIHFVELKTLNKEGLFMSSVYEQLTPDTAGGYKKKSMNYQHKYLQLSDSLVIYDNITIAERYTTRFRYVDTYANGKLASSTTYSEGAFLSKNTYRYDDRDNRVYWADSSTTDLVIRTFTYDEHNRMTSFSVRNDESGVFNETFYTYDAFGNQVKQRALKNGVIYQRDSYTDTYTYDAQHNWTKRVRRKLNGKQISILERKITYY